MPSTTDPAGSGSYPPAASAYARAGVDIVAGERAVDLIKPSVRASWAGLAAAFGGPDSNGPRVLGDLGAFSGMVALGSRFEEPVLVSSTDGVGTKLKIAIELDRHNTIGRDLVAHCVDDILTCGAVPLFFLDYVGMGKLVPERLAAIVDGMAAECQANGCALVGGETAEMPDLYAPDEYDLAGFIVGVVERDGIIDGSKIEEGNLVWGLESTGLHTNGYTLARKVLADFPLTDPYPGLDGTIGDVLLATHRSYLPTMRPLLTAGIVRGMAHITGGGFEGNIPRMLPKGLGVELRWGGWRVPPIFDLIQRQGGIAFEEMTRVFNMGLGWVFVTSEADGADVQQIAPDALLVGRIVRADGEGGPRVRLLGAP
ncbi:MAG: phosphoribosylformylglycinamidine cyclo-ligase [Chloroflexi bacterium]|nr:phosphoribosylformylglycinamidine cyclo-ligase [Chloroflexota bacterium]